MIASAPAACACRASASVVAVANQAMPLSLNLSTNSGGNNPMIRDTPRNHVGFRWRQRKKKSQQENWNIAEHAENLAQIQGLEVSRLLIRDTGGASLELTASQTAV